MLYHVVVVIIIIIITHFIYRAVFMVLKDTVKVVKEGNTLKTLQK